MTILEAAVTEATCRPCRAQMHLHCRRGKCDCTVCRHTCELCGNDCTTSYLVPDAPEVKEEARGKRSCMFCYSVLTMALPKGQGCESCGGPRGYRDPSDSRGLYLCIACRGESSGSRK